MDFYPVTQGCLAGPVIALGVLATGACAAELPAGIAAAPAASAQAGSRPFAMDAELLADRSTWIETDAQGHRLVTETGRLTGIRLGGQRTGRSGSAGLSWSMLHGQRDYDGVSNLGRPVSSSARIGVQTWELYGLVPIRSGWQIDLALRHTALERDLAGTASAAGYLEHWRWWQAAIGGRWQRQLATSTLTLAASRRWAYRTAVTADLPTSDPVTLYPGAGQGWQAGFSWEYPLAADLAGRWQFGAGWSWQSLGLAPSPAAALTRSGVLRGSAAQPATEMRDQLLQIFLHRHW